ncbi:MAG: TraB domain-containing protein, partial [Treponema sp.]|nr:TraB domain-containing protein [Treponema sp.]
MNSNNVRLTGGGRDIHLIGTAHVSRESIEEVTGAIREEKPGMVCVELDQGRYASITRQDSWERLDITKVLKERKGFLLIANLALASFQRRLGNELGVRPGEEMIAAVQTAQEMGIGFSLCDREVQVTLRRAWASCGFFSKCKLLAALLSSAFV